MAALTDAELDDIFWMNHILNDFVQFLPILTLSNFIRSFPEYKYDQLSAIKEVYAFEKSIHYSKLKITSNRFNEPHVTDIETDKFDSNTVRTLIEKHTNTLQEIAVTVNRIQIAHMDELFRVFLTKLHGKEHLEQTISATDSIGLHDVLQIEDNFDSEKSYNEQTSKAVAAHFVLLFLAVILPLDRVTLQSGYFWLYTGYYDEGYALYIAEEGYSFTFQNGDKSIRKVGIVRRAI